MIRIIIFELQRSDNLFDCEIHLTMKSQLFYLRILQKCLKSRFKISFSNLFIMDEGLTGLC